MKHSSHIPSNHCDPHPLPLWLHTFLYADLHKPTPSTTPIPTNPHPPPRQSPQAQTLHYVNIHKPHTLHTDLSEMDWDREITENKTESEERGIIILQR